MKSRWKHDRPMSRTDFDLRFPDEGACARHLANLRWPEGFTCPVCGTCKGWELETKPFTWEPLAEFLDGEEFPVVLDCGALAAQAVAGLPLAARRI
jgi:hypothetical protein